MKIAMCVVKDQSKTSTKCIFRKMKILKKEENLNECLQHLDILTLCLNSAQKCQFSCLNGVKVESHAKQNVINILFFARPLLAHHSQCKSY